MRLIDTLFDLLVEASGEEIRQKYYSDIDKNVFLRIISLDPATKIGDDGSIKKIGKYSKVLLKMHKTGNLKPEDYPKAKDYLTLVYKHNVGVDLKKVVTLGDLFGLVEKYYSREGSKNVFDLLNVLDQNEYELLMSGEKWIIYTPKSEKSAAYLGTGTEWCTSWGPYSTNDNYKDRKNHFTSHNNKGSLYVIINRNEPSEKYQFHFETKQFMDKNDRSVDTGNFFYNNEGVTKYFFPSLYDDTPVDDDEIGRMKFLNNEMNSRLVNRIIGETDNPLINLLVDGDGDEIENGIVNYISDDNLTKVEYDFRERNIVFTIDGLMDDSELENLQQTTRYYEMDSDRYADHSESLRYDIQDSDNDYQDKLLETVLKLYFEKTPPVWADNYETFKENMFHHREDLLENYTEEYSYINEDHIRTAAETELNNITKLIHVSEEEVSIPPSQLALFLNNEKLTEINDIVSLFSAFVVRNDLDYEYENPQWNIEMDHPSLSEMNSHIEGYSDKIEEELEQTPECVTKREELIKIREQFFNKGMNFSKDDIRIEIRSGYNCQEGGVEVIINYLEKTNEEVSNWKRWRGHITLERLVEYITNERLLEFKS